jgi:two-component system chemotaxis sensor kinase CheA
MNIDQSLLQDFIAETEEHLDVMEASLLKLETLPGDSELLNEVFRSVHTIKGASDYLGMERITELSHKLENLLDKLRQGDVETNDAVIDVLIAGKDRITQLIADLERVQTEETDIDDLLEMLLSIDGSNDETAKQESGGRESDGDSHDGKSNLMDQAAEPQFYQEEHDEELFSIFISQLGEGFEQMLALRDMFLSNGDPTVLDEWQEKIAAQRSSANYMGYEKLLDVYDKWDAQLGEAKNNGVDQDSETRKHFWETALVKKIEQIVNFFPQDDSLSAIVAKLCDYSDIAVPPDTFDKQDDAFLTDDCLDDLLDSSTVGEVAEEAIDGEDEEDLLLFDDEELGLETTQDTPAETADTSDPTAEVNLDQSLLQDFITETEEHLEEMETGLLKLETSPDDADLLNDVFRSVHTIKGASDYLGMQRIAELSHKLENLLDKLRSGEFETTGDAINLLIDCKDRLGQLLADLDKTQKEETQIDDLLEQLTDFNSGSAESPDPIQTEGQPEVPTVEPTSTALEEPDEAEFYTEEQDEELLAIFIGQLIEGFDQIIDLREAFEGGDITNVLDKWREKIGALHSSANYMGYEKILSIYDEWDALLKEAQETFEDEDQETLQSFWSMAVAAKIQQIAGYFPQADDLNTYRQMVAGPIVDEQADEAEQPSTDDPASAIDSLLCSIDDNGEDEANDDAEAGSATSSELEERLWDAFDELQPIAINEEVETATDFSGELFSSDEDSVCAPEEIFEDVDSNQVFSDQQTDVIDEVEGQQQDDSGEMDAQSALDSLTDSETVAPSLDSLFSEDGDTPELNESADPPAVDDTASNESFHFDELIEEPLEDIDANLPSEVAHIQNTVAVDNPPADQEAAALESQQATEATQEKMIKQPSANASDGDKSGPAAVAGDKKQPSKPVKLGEKLFKQSIRVDAQKIDALMNQVGELVVNRAFFSQLYQEMRELTVHLQQNIKLDKREMKRVKGISFRLSEATVSLGRVANELQEGVMKVRMLPIAQLFNRYPRLVHDLVRESGKKVNLVLQGEDTELDKMVIEEIADPLIHIIRNAVDHGIETPEERKIAAKSETGTLSLEAYHESNHVVIEIADDGKGINLERIKAKALEKQIVTVDDLAQMTHKEVVGLITQPGFSTTDRITHTSGRGVGMDVVKKNVEKLNGTLEIETIPGKETRMRIKIPLTLAIIPALLVTVSEELFTIPLSAVDETIRIYKDDISTIEGIEVIHLRDETIPLLRLAEVFALDLQPALGNKYFVVIVKTESKRIGLVVDSLLGQEEVVIKPLEDYLQENSGFSGATILGDGQISLILDVYELFSLCMDKHAKKKLMNAPL